VADLAEYRFGQDSIVDILELGIFFAGPHVVGNLQVVILAGLTNFDNLAHSTGVLFEEWDVLTVE
jgi:hypothetical protein